MKPTLEQKIVARSEFARLGLEVKTKFFFPTDKQEVEDIPNHLVVGRGKERYILEKTIPLSVSDEDVRYKVTDSYEVGE